MRMSKRSANIMRAWAAMGVMFMLLQGAFCGGWLALEQTIMKTRAPGPVIGLVVVYCVLLVVVLVVSGIRIGNATLPRVYREAGKSGLPAQARVQTVEQTRWHTGRTRDFRLRVHRRRWEYVMRVTVMPSGTEPYEVEVAAYLERAPKISEIVPVKIHAEHPDVVVIDEVAFHNDGRTQI
jgi:hypothetical protein